MKTDHRSPYTSRSPAAALLLVVALLLMLLAAVCLCPAAADLVIHSSSGAADNSSVTIEVSYLEEAYVYCREGNKEHADRLVVWQTSDNQTVGSFMQGSRVFTTGCRAHLPHCILVFVDFGSDVAGEYRCMSLLPGTPPISTSVVFKEVPSTVVTAGRCWVAPRKGALSVGGNFTVECFSA